MKRELRLRRGKVVSDSPQRRSQHKAQKTGTGEPPSPRSYRAWLLVCGISLCTSLGIRLLITNKQLFLLSRLTEKGPCAIPSYFLPAHPVLLPPAACTPSSLSLSLSLFIPYLPSPFFPFGLTLPYPPSLLPRLPCFTFRKPIPVAKYFATCNNNTTLNQPQHIKQPQSCLDTLLKASSKYHDALSMRLFDDQA